jgi:hypothetical protein
MKFEIVCLCLLLQVAVRAEDIWKWSSSTPLVSTTEASSTTAASTQESSFRHAGLTTAEIVESNDSYHVAVSGKYTSSS